MNGTFKMVIKGMEGDDKHRPGNIIINPGRISPRKLQLSHQPSNELIRAMENAAKGIILAGQGGAGPSLALLPECSASPELQAGRCEAGLC